MAVAEPQQLGDHLSAVIGLRTDPVRTESAATALASLSETEHVAVTTGRYDVLAWVNVVDAAALLDFLQHKADAVNGVRQTEKFIRLGFTQTRPLRRSGPSGWSLARPARERFEICNTLI